MRILLTFSLCLLAVTSQARHKKRTFLSFWGIHQRHEKVNGLSIGIASIHLDSARPATTNGIKAEILGLGIGTGFLPRSPVPLTDSEFVLEKDHRSLERVNGLSIAGTGTVCDCDMNGVTLGLIGHIQKRVNGISCGMVNISMVHNGIKLGIYTQTSLTNGTQVSFHNYTNRLNGLQAAFMINEANTMKGMQVGLINKSSRTRGIQIGLWNINEKRKFPIVNWNFRKKNDHIFSEEIS